MPGEVFIISSGAMDRIEEQMRALLERVRVKNSLLLDRGGYVFHYAGSFPFLPPQEMGAIVSGAFASLNTLVSMSAANELTVKFHHSPLGCLLLSPVTGRTLLAISFDDEVGSESDIIAEALRFVSAIKPHIEVDETDHDVVPGELPFSSVMFIEERLNELFDQI